MYFLENLNCTHLHPGVSERSCKTIDILWNWKTFFLHHLCISQRYFGSCRDWTCQKPTWENWWKNKLPGYNPKHCFPVRWEIWKGMWELWVFSSLWWYRPNRRRELYRLVIFRESLLFTYNWLKNLKYSVIHISTHPSKELCSKMALGEVGVSLPWWCHALVLPAPGSWGHFLNLIIFKPEVPALGLLYPPSSVPSVPSQIEYLLT